MQQHEDKVTSRLGALVSDKQRSRLGGLVIVVRRLERVANVVCLLKLRRQQEIDRVCGRNEIDDKHAKLIQHKVLPKRRFSLMPVIMFL